MALADPVQVRLPEEILAETDAVLEEMRRSIPGAVFTRSDAIRSLVLAGLRLRQAKQST